ncbi:hypothetical protein [Marinicella marina]|uniref:hypothetical protein n=1 Tax=Marinicella marina TaxID=2996016 RepID=UPI0024BD47C2|nr:hypothetical protein [Marinicella marina]
MSYDQITIITPLQHGYSLIKRHGDEPNFEIWLGTSTVRDFVACFSFNDAVNFLLSSGLCADYKKAIKLLNKGDCND